MMNYFKEGSRVVSADTVYTILPCGEFGPYKVMWFDKSGENYAYNYDAEFINNAILTGTWSLLKEVGDINKGEIGDKFILPATEEVAVKPDAVNSPKHYSVFEDVEAIQVIAGAMTEQQFYGYCLGNILKYRLRAGGKDDVMQELGKADKYQELYTQHKHLCRGDVL